jgi:hypothetical protein
MNSDTLLSDADLERIYGIPRGTSRAWRARGQGPPYLNLGRRMPRYRRANVESWFSERRVVPSAAKVPTPSSSGPAEGVS